MNVCNAFNLSCLKCLVRENISSHVRNAFLLFIVLSSGLESGGLSLSLCAVEAVTKIR